MKTRTQLAAELLVDTFREANKHNKGKQLQKPEDWAVSEFKQDKNESTFIFKRSSRYTPILGGLNKFFQTLSKTNSSDALHRTNDEDMDDDIADTQVSSIAVANVKIPGLSITRCNGHEVATIFKFNLDSPDSLTQMMDAFEKFLALIVLEKTKIPASVSQFYQERYAKLRENNIEPKTMLLITRWLAANSRTKAKEKKEHLVLPGRIVGRIATMYSPAKTAAQRAEESRILYEKDIHKLPYTGKNGTLEKDKDRLSLTYSHI